MIADILVYKNQMVFTFELISRRSGYIFFLKSEFYTKKIAIFTTDF